MVRIDVSNYCSWMDTWCTWTPLSSIDIWLVKNESLEEVEKKKNMTKRTQTIEWNGLDKSWQIGNMIGNGISEIGLLASSI